MRSSYETISALNEAALEVGVDDARAAWVSRLQPLVDRGDPPRARGTRERVAAVGAYPYERARMRSPAPPVRAGPPERSAQDWRRNARARTRAYPAGTT